MEKPDCPMILFLPEIPCLSIGCRISIKSLKNTNNTILALLFFLTRIIIPSYPSCLCVLLLLPYYCFLSPGKGGRRQVSGARPFSFFLPLHQCCMEACPPF